VYNYNFLHVIRLEELKLLQKHLVKGEPILEVGGGTGYQAKVLSEAGFAIVSMDLLDGRHAKKTVFPVKGYDGKTIPSPDKSFSSVFSSHTFGWAAEANQLQNEIHRVLSDDGIAIHIVPSNTWEMWTLVSGFFDIVPRLWHTVASLKEGRKPKDVFIDLLKRIYVWLFVWKRTAVGSRANNFIAWRKNGWINLFGSASFEVYHYENSGLFYTGNMLLGPRLPISVRRILAKFLGSSAYLFVLKKAAPGVPVLQAAHETALHFTD
jgi:SAM-dependent methyltransferase